MMSTMKQNKKGYTEWRCDGKLHREDGPALYDDNGNECWFYNNELHRVDGPAELWHGSERWHRHGQLHRVGGPAIVYHNPNFAHYGDQEWWQHNELHREDGPAIIVGYDKSCMWYIRNNHITNRAIYQQLTGLTDEEMTVLILKYGDFNG